MTRPLRIEFAGALYHVTSRGNNLEAIFKDDHDREKFLAILNGVNKRYRWVCHAYCLMNNHYHLIIETPDGNLSSGMRQLNGVYTQLCNARHAHVGHLFQGRYKSILIQRESYLLEVCRYVVLNPVRARLVSKPEAWRWSSYRAMIGRESPRPCLTTEWILHQFGNRRKDAIRTYEHFVKEGIHKRPIWESLRGQSLLGDENFTERFLDYLKGHRDISDIPKSQRYVDKPTLNKMFPKDISGRISERNALIKTAVEIYGYTQREVARHLGLHFTTINRIVAMLTK